MPHHEQILSVAQMRAAEEALIAAGVSVESLMESAGHGAAEWVWRTAGQGRVTVLCGPGNNGGDGYVLARVLHERGGDVSVVAAAEPRTATAQKAKASYKGRVCDIEEEVRGEVFVDCLFGSGLSRFLSDAHAMLVRRLADAHRLSIAADLPSGVDTDTGHVCTGDLPRYDLTIAFGAWKPAHVLMPAAASMGALRLVPIGVKAVAGASYRLQPPVLTPPVAQAHKYARGLVTVVAGAMPGAAALAAEAALRSGAGYVRLHAQARSRASHAIVQDAADPFDKAKAVLVGPGLGHDPAARQRLEDALATGIPVVADADALGLLADRGWQAEPVPAIVTPHHGEFVRAFGTQEGSKIERARGAARFSGAVVVYKGADTVIAAPDGRVVVADHATSWLSTAGTGDLLAGLCAGRLALTGDPFAATCEAVWLHAETARRAGPAFAADDLIPLIPAAIAACL